MATTSQRLQGVAISRPTTRTEWIGGNVRVPRDEDTFTRFIEDMFQFIIESAGGKASRIPLTVQKTHVIVGDLAKSRHDAEHDLEHGCPGEVRKKMIEVGQILKKYGELPKPTKEQEWIPLQEQIYTEPLQFMDGLAEYVKKEPKPRETRSPPQPQPLCPLRQ